MIQNPEKRKINETDCQKTKTTQNLLHQDPHIQDGKENKLFLILVKNCKSKDKTLKIRLPLCFCFLQI